LKIEPKFDKE